MCITSRLSRRLRDGLAWNSISEAQNGGENKILIRPKARNTSGLFVWLFVGTELEFGFKSSAFFFGTGGRVSNFPKFYRWSKKLENLNIIPTKLRSHEPRVVSQLTAQNNIKNSGAPSMVRKEKTGYEFLEI